MSWSKPLGARTQYHWRTTFSPADLHAMGLPASIQPHGPVAVGVTLSSAGDGFSGVAEAAGSALKFTASAPVNGRRRVNLSGAVEGASLASLGLGSSDLIGGRRRSPPIWTSDQTGCTPVTWTPISSAPRSTRPFVTWMKPAGRAMQISADFVRRGDGALEVTALKGQGPGFGLAASGLWRPKGSSLLQVSAAKLEGAFDGSLDLATDADGQRLTTRARYLDIRRMLQQNGPSAVPGGRAPADPPLRRFISTPRWVRCG